MAAVDRSAPLPLGRRRRVRVGDAALHATTLLAAAAGVALVGLVAYEVFDEASEAISRFRLGFLVHQAWDPVAGRFGALDFVYGTAITSFLALAIAGPLSIAI